jgi:hypothetical protein
MNAFKNVLNSIRSTVCFSSAYFEPQRLLRAATRHTTRETTTVGHRHLLHFVLPCAHLTLKSRGMTIVAIDTLAFAARIRTRFRRRFGLPVSSLTSVANGPNVIPKGQSLAQVLSWETELMLYIADYRRTDSVCFARLPARPFLSKAKRPVFAFVNARVEIGHGIRTEFVRISDKPRHRALVNHVRRILNHMAIRDPRGIRKEGQNDQ